jgi:aspartate/methionine/tyrosine aminotransferase
MSDFRPFEYMAWAKAIPPGARHALHLSGIGVPAALRLPVPDWSAWTAPVAGPREALLDGLRAHVNAPDADGVVVSGASEAVFVALAAHVRRGEPVIVERPAYGAIERCVQFLGGTAAALERWEADGWRFDIERLDALLAETGARVVAITDPHNPTGVSIDAATRRAALDVIERRRALLVVDEIFAAFRGPQRAPAWAAESACVLSLGSLTKAWGLAALRTGWVLGAPALVAACRQVFDLLGVNAPSATVVLARAALECAPDLDARARRASECVYETYAATDWSEAGMVRPDDGIIGFLRLPAGWRSETATAVLRDLDGVQVVPGHFFGSDAHVRIGFDPNLTDGAEACRLIAARLGGPPPAPAVR